MTRLLGWVNLLSADRSAVGSHSCQHAVHAVFIGTFNACPADCAFVKETSEEYGGTLCLCRQHVVGTGNVRCNDATCVQPSALRD